MLEQVADALKLAGFHALMTQLATAYFAEHETS
jgi:hypothetical protein